MLEHDDRFTGRVGRLYEIGAVQSRVAHEDMARDTDFGNDGPGVNTFYGRVFLTDEAVPVGELVEKMREALDGTVCLDLLPGGRIKLALVVGDAAVVTLDSIDGAIAINAVFASFPVGCEWTPERLTELMADLGYAVGHDLDDDSMVPISFAMPGANGLRLMSKKFRKLTLDSVRRNYSPDVIEGAERAIEILSAASNGIFILNGPPGTGKSYLIRAILSELKGVRHPVFCTPPQKFLTEAVLLADAIVSASADHSGPEEVIGTAVIMEDVGELLTIDNVTNHVDATANLLNFSDGLLSLLGDAVFILTFNHEMDAINPALTRPGRCLGQLTVGTLGRGQAEAIAGFGGLEDRQYTLAEAYEMKRVGRQLTGATKKRAGLVK